MREVDVRRATVEDAAALGRFMEEAWREAGPDSPGFAGATPELIAQIAAPGAVRAGIDAGGRRMFLACRGGDVIGFAATRPVDDASTELAGIVVKRDAARGGLGRRLVGLAVATAAADGFGRMIVRTERDNAGALAFYAACGFSVVGDAVERVEGVEILVTELALDVSVEHGGRAWNAAEVPSAGPADGPA